MSFDRVLNPMPLDIILDSMSLGGVSKPDDDLSFIPGMDINFCPTCHNNALLTLPGRFQSW